MNICETGLLFVTPSKPIAEIKSRKEILNNIACINPRFMSQARRTRHFERSATQVRSFRASRKLLRSPRWAHKRLLCMLADSPLQKIIKF